MKPPVNPKTHFISSYTLMPLRFSMTRPLMERSEKGRLIVTAKMLQERFDRYTTDPCLPHLVAAMVESASPTGVEQSGDTEPVPVGQAESEEAPTASWTCAFNNLGSMEKRLRTQHGKITVESMCLGHRLRKFVWDVYDSCSRFHTFLPLSFSPCRIVHIWTMHSKLHFQVQVGCPTRRLYCGLSVHFSFVVLTHRDVRASLLGERNA